LLLATSPTPYATSRVPSSSERARPGASHTTPVARQDRHGHPRLRGESALPPSTGPCKRPGHGKSRGAGPATGAAGGSENPGEAGPTRRGTPANSPNTRIGAAELPPKAPRACNRPCTASCPLPPVLSERHRTYAFTLGNIERVSSEEDFPGCRQLPQCQELIQRTTSFRLLLDEVFHLAEILLHPVQFVFSI
jgi:hypothetical protein